MTLRSIESLEISGYGEAEVRTDGEGLTELKLPIRQVWFSNSEVEELIEALQAAISPEATIGDGPNCE